ncbi:MAG: DUF1800 domain-containing protein [Gammaproteobacteria bacterium]|nr:DUF1800 domain-containing protein [Gammaproteobacteria bacterium]
MAKAKYLITICCTLWFASTPVWATDLDLDHKMDETTARAMLNRFGLGADETSLATAMRETPRQYLINAIQGETRLPAPIVDQIQSLPIAQPLNEVWAQYGPGGSARANNGENPDAKKLVQKTENDYLNAAIQARLLTMANSNNQGHESLLSFWLNHFSIYGEKDSDKLLAWDYAHNLEWAMKADSFEALLKASFYHAAMQVYLDNAQSTSPTSTAGYRQAFNGKEVGINENLARELMELHTLGVDAGYTQKDVQELARIITGAGIYSPKMNDANLKKAGVTQMGLFLFDPRRHDFGAKIFLNQDFPAGQGFSEIDRALHILAINPTTAHHIALKLAREYLSDNPPKTIVDAMTAGYMHSGGKISATLLPLLSSHEFALSLTSPTKFKDPLNYTISAARIACSGTPIGNRFLLTSTMRDMGEAPFLHTTPDGYGVTESDWLSPAAMAKRTRLAMSIASNKAPFASFSTSFATNFANSSDVNNTEPSSTMPMNTTAPMPSTTAPISLNPKQLAKNGIACQPNINIVEKLIGPVSSTTQAAEAGLSDAERIGLLLASPEFMQR